MQIHKVLVVDDDHSVLQTYRRLLQKCGYDVMTAENPSEVLRNLDSYSSAELVILDYRMPIIDGLTLLVEMRKRNFLPKAILISAYLTDEIRKRAAVLGIKSIFSKPVDVMKLKESIKHALQA